MKKLGHLVCQDQAAALGVSIYNIACNNTACNKSDNICVLAWDERAVSLLFAPSKLFTNGNIYATVTKY